MKKIKINKLGGKVFQVDVIKRLFMFFPEAHKTIFGEDGTLFVVSAADGVTRLLRFIFRFLTEKNLSEHFREVSITNALEELERIHMDLINNLFENDADKEEILSEYRIISFELETIIHNGISEDKKNESYPIVLKYGELFSSKILSSFLTSLGIKNELIDVRDYIVTDCNFAEAKIIGINDNFKKLFNSNKIIVTQGFIGRNYEAKDTVLGLDGSDYTASEIASYLAEYFKVHLNIWKDKLGVYSKDPKDPKAKLFSKITRRRCLELAERNKEFIVRPDSIDKLDTRVTLRIRSFLNLKHKGTVII